MKILSNFELPLWLNCNKMYIKVVISIKYGWNTIVWATKTYVDKISGIWILFIWKHKVIDIIPGKKSSWSHITFLHKSYNKVFDKIKAFSSSLLPAIIARNHLPFLKIFSNFVHFCLYFQIFCPFSEKSHACSYFLE